MVRRFLVPAAALVTGVAACDAPASSGPDAAEAPAVDAPTPAAPLVIVTINLRCLIDAWDARLPVLVDGLVAANPDLVGVEEVCSEPGGRDALEELVAALAARGAGDFAYTRTTTHRAWDAYDEGLAILSRHPIGAVHIEALPAGAIPRKVVVARIVAPAGDVAIAVTHLDHQSAPVRAEQAVAAARALDRAGAGLPAILVGDLNEGPGSGVGAALAQAGMTDAWATLHPGDPGFTFPASSPDVRIDYVWTRGDVVGAATIERIMTVPAGSVFASDHVGVRASLGPRSR